MFLSHPAAAVDVDAVSAGAGPSVPKRYQEGLGGRCMAGGEGCTPCRNRPTPYAVFWGGATRCQRAALCCSVRTTLPDSSSQRHSPSCLFPEYCASIFIRSCSAITEGPLTCPVSPRH